MVLSYNKSLPKIVPALSFTSLLIQVALKLKSDILRGKQGQACNIIFQEELYGTKISVTFSRCCLSCHLGW